MCKFPLLACLATSFVLPVTAATVIYQDDFSGNVADPLNGQMTDLGSGTWTASGIFANGSVPTKGSKTAYLPFAPVAGMIYTATIGMDFLNSPAGNGSMQFGFSGTPSNSAPLTSYTNAAGHAFIRQNGSAESRRIKDSTIASVATATYNDGTPDVDTVTLVLDTTGTAWTFQAAVNGNNIGSLYTYTTNPTISNIVFGTNDADGSAGTFSNFSLTSVPEPSALLLSMAGGFLLFRRRRN